MLFGRRKTIVVPLDSRDDILAALRLELETAPEELRAGLTRAIEVTEDVEVDEQTMQRRYAQRLLDEAGVDPNVDKLLAIRVLRQEVPGLSVAAATKLAELAADEEGFEETL